MSGDKAGELVSAALIGAATAYVLYVCYPNAVQSVKDKIGTLLLRDTPENESPSTTTKVPIRKVRRRKPKSSSGCGYPSSSSAEEEEEEEIEWEEEEFEVPSSSSSSGSSSGFDFERFIFTSEEIDKMSAGTIVFLNEEVRNLLKALKEIPQNGFLTELLRPAQRVLSKSLPGSPKSINARTTKEKEADEEVSLEVGDSKTKRKRGEEEDSPPSAGQEDIAKRFVARLKVTPLQLSSLSNSERDLLTRHLTTFFDLTLDKMRDMLEHSELCAICCERPRSVAYLPCGHFGCCGTCAEVTEICPFCREGKRKLQLFVV